MRFHSMSTSGRTLTTASLVASALLLFACGDDSVTGGGSAGGAPPGGGENPGGAGGGNPNIAGGNNSGGGTTGPNKIGDECVTDADCDADVGVCIAQVTNGFPKGYCTALCDGDVDCGEGVCFEDAQTPFCLFPCSDTEDCRAGYGCQTISAATSSDACFPACTANSDCATPAECITDEADGNFGFCIEDEVCNDDTDNDLDGRPDCTDSDCTTISPCQEQIATACTEAGAFTTPSAGDTSTGDNLFAPVNCGGTGNTGFGNELLFSYTATAKGQLHIEAVPTDSDLVLYARLVCAGDDADMLDCSDDPQDGAATEIIDIGLLQDQQVTIFVDTWQPGNEGAYALTSTFTPAICGDGMTTLPETCDDTNALSGDGCSDVCEVELDFYCTNAIPLVLNTPVSGNTATGTNLFQAPQDALECTFGGAGLAPGQEVLYVYTPATSGMLTVDLTSTSDTDFGLYARTDCLDVATQLGCSDVNFMAGMNDETLTIPVTMGVPVTIFVDAYQVAGGAFSIELSQN